MDVPLLHPNASGTNGRSHPLQVIPFHSLELFPNLDSHTPGDTIQKPQTHSMVMGERKGEGA